MLLRALVLAALLAIPLRVQADSYVVRAGDTLTAIAHRYHVSLATLAQLNGLRNLDLIRIGSILNIPEQRRTFSYRVQWGDTLLGLAARYGTTVATIRALNPRLGLYPLAGQWLRLCNPCGSGGGGAISASGSIVSTSTTGYVVRPGDTLIGIAARYGVTAGAIMAASGIRNPDLIVIGTHLTIPISAGAGYDPWTARSLIVTYARQYGLDPALPLAVGWQESGFNQTLVSRTGAIGVMQVEPYTADHIAWLWGRPVHLNEVDDNIHAGVYWLSQLLAYYSGDEELAVAAYYQGTKSIARVGLFDDTKQYVADVMSLKSSFGG